MRRAALLALACAVPAQGSAAQERGVIYGTVRDSAGKPVGQAIVAVAGANLRAIADLAGSYRLAGVPAGQVALRAALIGFSSDTHTVTLPPGDSVRVDFELRATRIELNP
ncbi:MAG: carboxypeptidase-like regulatory domain-containing protein, partial [Candidatus Eiseniibacteriota bacterium]